MTADEANVQAWFERTVVGAIRFCGQSLFMLRFLVSRPSTLSKSIAAGDQRLAPPLSFLTLGVFVFGMVQRLSYVASPTETGMAESFATEFQSVYSQISLWEVALFAFPGVVLVVLIAVLVAKAVANSRPFEQNPIVAAICYATGLFTLVVGLVYFAIITINALYSSADDIMISYRQHEQLMMAAVAWTALYAALAIAVAIRTAGGRRHLANPLIHFPVGVVTTVALLGVTYLTVTISFDLDSLDQQQSERWNKNHGNGFWVSIIDRYPIADPLRHASQQSVTLALKNLSDETIIVPRHRFLRTGDNQGSLTVVSSSVDQCEGKALIIEPRQTRMIELVVDMTPVAGKSILGETSQQLILTYHQGDGGLKFLGREHRLSLPIPSIGIVGQGLRLPERPRIGRRSDGSLYRAVQ